MYWLYSLKSIPSVILLPLSPTALFHQVSLGRSRQVVAIAVLKLSLFVAVGFPEFRSVILKFDLWTPKQMLSEPA